MPDITPFEWHLTATDVHDELVPVAPESDEMTTIVVYNTEKRFFDDHNDALKYIRQHLDKYLPTTPERFRRKADDICKMYQLLKIDTEMVPDYEDIFLEYKRPKDNVKQRKTLCTK